MVLPSFILVSCLLYLLSFMLVWCFDFDLFYIQLSVNRCWICETYIYITPVCVCVCVCMYMYV
jgi:hypothetical protein